MCRYARLYYLQYVSCHICTIIYARSYMYNHICEIIYVLSDVSTHIIVHRYLSKNVVKPHICLMLIKSYMCSDILTLT